MRRRSTIMQAGLLLLAAGVASAQSPAARTVDDPTLQWGACPEFLPAGCQIAVLNGDPAQPNADIFFSVPAGARIARHWHSSAERMVLVQGELEVSYDGADTVTLRPGTYAYGPARAPHEARCLSAEPCVLFIAFESPVDAVAGDPPDA
jgi:quercetin dioxygenase-like cupin family protein